MDRVSCLAVTLLFGANLAAAADPKTADKAGPKLPAPMVKGLKSPESVVVGTDGRIYVSEIGEFDKDGDGAISVIQGGKAVPFATGLDDPKGLVAFQEFLFVADKNKIWRIDRSGKPELYVPANAFPTTP